MMGFAMEHHRKTAVILVGALALTVDALMRQKQRSVGNLKDDQAELEELVKNMTIAYENFCPN